MDSHYSPLILCIIIFCVSPQINVQLIRDQVRLKRIPRRLHGIYNMVFQPWFKNVTFYWIKVDSLPKTTTEPAMRITTDDRTGNSFTRIKIFLVQYFIQPWTLGEEQERLAKLNLPTTRVLNDLCGLETNMNICIAWHFALLKMVWER